MLVEILLAVFFAFFVLWLGHKSSKHDNNYMYLTKDLEHCEYPNHYKYLRDKDGHDKIYYRHHLTGEYILLKEGSQTYKKVQKKIFSHHDKKENN